jgi:hypothetical protein
VITLSQQVVEGTTMNAIASRSANSTVRRRYLTIGVAVQSAGILAIGLVSVPHLI